VCRAAGRFVAGVGPGDSAETRGPLAGLKIFEFAAVKPDSEAHPAEIQPDAAAAFFAHLVGAARTVHTETRILQFPRQKIIADKFRLGPITIQYAKRPQWVGRRDVVVKSAAFVLTRRYTSAIPSGRLTRAVASPGAYPPP